MVGEQWDEYAKHIATLGVQALLYEVAVTPKPGLVDLVNNGAHRDMDVFLFQNSAACLWPYFYEVTRFSMCHRGAPSALLEELRGLGIRAEEEMLLVTGGVNTHRGAIFSLGICCAAAGWLGGRGAPPEAEKLLEISGEIAGGAAQEFAGLGTGALSHGARQYFKVGARGARGEAAAGFPSVGGVLPIYKELLGGGASGNEAGVAVLLHLLAQVEDTNMLHRGGREALGKLQGELAAFLAAKPSPRDMVRHAKELDEVLIRQNLSPGGCADLLALTWLVHRICDRGGAAESGAG